MSAREPILIVLQVQKRTSLGVERYTPICVTSRIGAPCARTLAIGHSAENAAAGAFCCHFAIEVLVAMDVANAHVHALRNSRIRCMPCLSRSRC